MDGTSASDRILSATRWVAALVIPFLVVAFIILYFAPGQTAALFAWKLQPTMSAMMLGSAYAGGIYFLTGVLAGAQWHRIKVGFPPVIAFASLLGIATILHWDRFNQGHVSFWAWAGLYFTTPFLVFAVWLRNRREDPNILVPGDTAIPRAMRWLVGTVGVATLIISALLFVGPERMIALWPWTLSPLTARVASAMFALPGLVGLGIALDQRWSAAQLILQAQAFSIALILIAAWRAWGELDQANPAALLFVGGRSGLLLGIVLLYVWMAARMRAHV
jgi:hypothetical protein